MTEVIEQKGAAFLLPDKIIIETMNKKDEGTWYSTGEITILPINVTDFELGECILRHLAYSKYEVATYEKIKNSWKELIKKAKYKTEKAFVQDAKRVVVIVNGNVMRIEPFKVKLSQKMFYRVPDGITEITPVPESSVLGRGVKKSWEKCLFID